MAPVALVAKMDLAALAALMALEALVALVVLVVASLSITSLKKGVKKCSQMFTFIEEILIYVLSGSCSASWWIKVTTGCPLSFGMQAAESVCIIASCRLLYAIESAQFLCYTIFSNNGLFGLPKWILVLVCSPTDLDFCVCAAVK